MDCEFGSKNAKQKTTTNIPQLMGRSLQECCWMDGETGCKFLCNTFDENVEPIEISLMWLCRMVWIDWKECEVSYIDDN